MNVSGTIWTDFKPQIENLNTEKLTIVAWDPPGYGKSRPPDRTFPDDFFQRDATWAHDLMQTLGYSKFSLIGWSEGGITSLLLARHIPSPPRGQSLTPGLVRKCTISENTIEYSPSKRQPIIAIILSR